MVRSTSIVVALSLASVASATHYENPTAGCSSGEMKVAIQGMTGDFCSPQCQGAVGSCPTDAPSGTATPQCLLQSPQGQKYCALVCTAGKAGECPTGANCEAAPGGQTSLCMYPTGKVATAADSPFAIHHNGFPIDVLAHGFKQWQEFHGKTYTKAEEAKRYTIFIENAAKVSKHNSGNHGWTMSLNENADLSEQEFEQQMGLHRKPATPAGKEHSSSGEQAPTAIDWRTKNLVTPVKNQGQCGSCWTFSTVVSLEGQHAKSSGKLVSLSEQNLVDCARNEKIGNQTCCNGCQGGLMDFAFKYLIDHQNGQIDTEASYPYTAAQGSCAFKSQSAGAKITGWKDVKQGDEAGLLDASATIGPISVAVDAAAGWQMYHGGVLTPVLCSSDPTKMDHGVAVVGYGTDSGKDYWIVKNSWGATWGEQGYVRLLRGKNACGVANAASYPTGVTSTSAVEEVHV